VDSGNGPKCHWGKEADFSTPVARQSNYEVVRIVNHMTHHKLDISMLVLSFVSFSFACADDVIDVDGADPSDWASKKDGTPGKGGINSGKGGSGTTDGGATGGGVTVAVTYCGAKVYACGDGIDNDGDMLVDGEDPECTTPCDDDENSFQTDMPGQNEDCKGDCFFDDNTGAGDDLCDQNLQCDPENPGALIGCEYDADLTCSGFPMVPNETCLSTCLPRVPNGCDCFGCCELGKEFVYLDGSPDCRLDNLEACQSCTFNEACANPCDTHDCELCFGQTPDDLPHKCGGQTACSEGVTSCQLDADCPADNFCQTGCCISIG
jgi:hypothetical protein